MSNAGILYGLPTQRQTKIILSTAALGGLNLTIPSDYIHHESNKQPQFLAKFPHGKIPAFEGQDGFRLFEGFAIAKYLATLSPQSGLLGTSEAEKAQIEQWIHFVDSEVQYYQIKWAGLIVGTIVPYSKSFSTFLTERHTRSLGTLESHLASRTFLVGERLTLADIVLAATLQRAVETMLGAAERSAHPNLVRHLNTVINRPKIKEIWRTTDFVDVPKAYTPPAKEKKEKAAKAD